MATPDYIPALRFHAPTPVYDRVVRTTTRERACKSALITQARLCPGQRVLDLGCGTATLAIWIKQRYPEVEVAALDGDVTILEIAQRKARNANVAIEFVEGLSFELPFADGEFDRVLSSLFFHHLVWPDKQRTARELFRVTAPGGELHVADWGAPTNPLMRLPFYAVQILDGFASTRDHVRGRLLELFGEAGFVNVVLARSYATMLGTLGLYRAIKPGGGA